MKLSASFFSGDVTVVLFVFPGLDDNNHRCLVSYGSCHHPHRPRSDVPMSNQNKR